MFCVLAYAHEKNPFSRTTYRVTIQVFKQILKAVQVGTMEKFELFFNFFGKLHIGFFFKLLQISHIRRSIDLFFCIKKIESNDCKIYLWYSKAPIKGATKL